MNAYLKDSKEMLDRVLKFAANHPAALSTSVSTLVPQIAAGVAQINALGGGQLEGLNVYRSGAELRQGVAKELRRALAEVATMGRILGKTTVPGLGAKLRMQAGAKSYQALRDAGTAYIDVLSPTAVKTAFTDRGFAPTFLTDLAGLVAAMETATNEKYGGLGKRVNSTAMLTAVTRNVVLVARELDAVMAPQLRKTDPGLYAEWKVAVHIRSRKKNGGTGVTRNQSGGAVISGAAAAAGGAKVATPVGGVAP